MDDLRQQRLAQNESLFRGINETQAAGHARFGLEDAQEFVCECADVGCTDRLRMTLREYERVRAESLRFVVAPGHDVPEVEQIVAVAPGFHVIEKIKAGADVAQQEDPRGGNR